MTADTAAAGSAVDLSAGLPARLDCYRLGLQPYLPVWRAMQSRLKDGVPGAPEEVWAVEHPPVLTLGRNARIEHVRDAGAVPLVRIDRGGQVTLHAPGQLVLYTLLDLRRHALGVRRLVTLLEDSMIQVFGRLGVDARARPDAPGVYVGDAKLAAIGLRIRDGRSMHGIAVNTRNRLDAFRRIDACGYPGLAATSLQRLGIRIDTGSLADLLESELATRLELLRNPRPVLPPDLIAALALRARPAPAAR